MFLGKSGYGTYPLAMAYARYLMCENRQENDACGACPTCNKISKGIHPDVHEVYPTHSVSKLTSIDFHQEWKEFRAQNPYGNLNDWKASVDEGKVYSIGTKESILLHKKLSLKTFEGGYKVLIVSMSETMNSTFANKFLKLMEEPPPNTVLLLLAEDADAMLPTILSRAQIKKVGAIETEVLTAKLIEGGVPEDEALSMCLRLNADWGLLQEELKTGDSVARMRELFIKMMRVCYGKKPIDMIDVADEIADLSKSSQISFLEYSLNMIRQSLMKNYTGDALFQASKSETDFLKNFARFITGNNVVDFMNLFSESVNQLQRNANARILFTRLTFKVMKLIHVA